MNALLFLAASATAAAPISAKPGPSPAEAKFDQCIELIKKSADEAISFAEKWKVDNGGIAARQCLAFAFASQGQWKSAAVAYEQAATFAERSHDRRVATLWVLTGNAAFAAGDPKKALSAFDTALTAGTLKGTDAGEAMLDRSRVLVALNNLKAARSSLDQAIKLAPTDPLGWLFSASLARRMGDLKRAETDINEAMRRAPDDASVAVEAGNIAMMKGKPDAAKTAWQAATRLAPDSPAGKAAKEALKQFEVQPKR